MRAALALGLLSGCAHHFECVRHGGKPVREVRTSHFAVVSDLPAASLRSEAVRIEHLVDAFAEFFGTVVPAAEIPVVLLSSFDAVEDFVPGYAGYVVRDGPVARVMGVPATTDEPGSIARELARLVSDYALPQQPLWLRVGLGMYLKDATVDDDETVTMGGWDDALAQEAFLQRTVDLPTLATWDESSPHGDTRQHYVSAWAWVHFLVNHQEARLRRLFEALRSGEPGARAVARVFPQAEAADLHSVLNEYVAQASFRRWSTASRRKPRVSATRELEPWEVHLVRSQLFRGDGPSTSREEAQVLALAPANPPAAAALVQARARGQSVRALLKRYPASPEVMVAASRAGETVSVQALTLQATGSRDPLLLLVAAREALTANALADAERFARAGREVAPWSDELSFTYFNVLLRSRRCSDAALELAHLRSLWAERRPPDARALMIQAGAELKACEAAPPE